MTTTTLLNALITFSQSLPGLLTAIEYLSWLIGVGMAGAGLYRFAATDRHSGGGGMGAGLVMVLGGVAMLSLANVMSSVSLTVLNVSSPGMVLAYGAVGGDYATVVKETLTDFIQLLGWVSGARGLYLLGMSGSRQSQDSLLWRGVTHLVGGGLAINLPAFACDLAATFGLPCSL